MGRRAAYQFGPLLAPGPRGHVDCGLGSAMGMARSDLIAPTTEITYTGEEMDLSGIRVVFQMTPDAEAPAEMNFFFPGIGPSAGAAADGGGTGLLCMAENCTHTLHNLYPIRGAQTRDALAWSKYIQEALLLWGDDAHTMFASHHWPRFGQGDVRGFLTMQRDVYRWMHDQTMRVFADPANTAARELQADALEQMGYQAESATWRNAYLMGAKELREGSPDWGRIPTRDMSQAMNADHIFDIIGVRFNPDTAASAGIEPGARIHFHFEDLDEHHLLGIGRSAINHVADPADTTADASLAITRRQLIQALDDVSVLDQIEISGNGQLVRDLIGGLDVFTTVALIEP